MDNSYEAMERMLEFGMGASLAQQMMRTMNECMQQTTIPIVQVQAPPMPQPTIREFYAVIDENVAGPFNEGQLAELVKNKKVTAETYVWAKGMSNWSLAKQIPEVNKAIILNSEL